MIKIDYSSEQTELLPTGVNDFERCCWRYVEFERLNGLSLLFFALSSTLLSVDVFNLVFPHFSTLV
jgi:hypothetical protein